MKLDLSEFKFKHCDHCTNCTTSVSKSINMGITCPYFMQCIINIKPGSIPSHFEGITELDTKYAKLLHEYIKLVKHLGFDIQL